MITAMITWLGELDSVSFVSRLGVNFAVFLVVWFEFPRKLAALSNNLQLSSAKRA